MNSIIYINDETCFVEITPDKGGTNKMIRYFDITSIVPNMLYKLEKNMRYNATTSFRKLRLCNGVDIEDLNTIQIGNQLFVKIRN